MKLKLAGLVSGYAELTKRPYLHHNATASAPTTTTAIKSKATIINSTATTINTGATNTAAKVIKEKNLGNTETELN